MPVDTTHSNILGAERQLAGPETNCTIRSERVETSSQLYLLDPGRVFALDVQQPWLERVFHVGEPGRCPALNVSRQHATT